MIIQNQLSIAFTRKSSRDFMVLPLTTRLKEKAKPLRFRVFRVFRIKAQDKLNKDADLLIDQIQIRAIDNKRLIEGPLTQRSMAVMEHVYQCISEIIGSDLPASHSYLRQG